MSPSREVIVPDQPKRPLLRNLALIDRRVTEDSHDFSWEGMMSLASCTEPTRRFPRAHAIASVFNARFSLSLYCSRRLYSVTSRRWTNDQWLSRSLKQAGQMLIAPSARHVSVVLPFEGESSTASLTVFLACILYFCHLFPSSFSTVSRNLRCDLERARLVMGFIAPLGTQVR